MEEWTCIRCGDAFYGIPPECGLCIACQEEIGEPPLAVRTWPEVRTDIFTDRDGELHRTEQLHDDIRAYRRDGGESESS
jgi:hypothetical protein